MGNIERSEAERWLAWLDSDRNNDGDVPLKGTPYQAAQRVAKRLHDQRGAVEALEIAQGYIEARADQDDEVAQSVLQSVAHRLGGQYEAE